MTFEKISSNSINKDVKDIHTKTIHIVKTGKSGKEITCLGGTIWITQKGDGIDRILTCGDIYQSRIPGMIIIEGLEPSKIRISSLQKVEVIGNFQNRRQPQLACT